MCSNKIWFRGLRQTPSKEELDAFHPDKWIDVSDPEEYNSRKQEHQQRHLRSLDLGGKLGCLGNRIQIPFPFATIAFLDSGSLLNIEVGKWYPCFTGTSRPNTQAEIIAIEARLRVSPAGPKCPKKSGDIQVYIPFSGHGRVIVLGGIIFEFSMRDCFSSFIMPSFHNLYWTLQASS